MSQENVETVQAAIDAFNKGDADGMFKNAAPHAECDLSRAVGPEVGVYDLRGMRLLFERFGEEWEQLRIEPHEFIEAGEHVAVPWTMHGRGRSGVDVQTRVTWVWTIQDRTVTRICMYQTRQDALEAMGLADPG
jgi:ketosteroid isomerase-like protein